MKSQYIQFNEPTFVLKQTRFSNGTTDVQAFLVDDNKIPCEDVKYNFSYYNIILEKNKDFEISFINVPEGLVSELF